MADEPRGPKTRADLLRTNMSPGEKALAKGVKSIGSLGARQPTRRTDPGAVIKFTYRHHTGAPYGTPLDDHKEVLVLHPNWQGKMHAIDLKRLTAAEREVLQAVFDPVIKQQKESGRPHRLPLVNDILNRMDPVQDIRNPVSFYSKFVKVFLRDKDAYRTYFPRLMWAVTVVQPTSVSGGVVNPKPLFKKIESRPQAPEPAPPGVLRRAAQAKGQLAGQQRPAPKPTDRQKRLELIKTRQAQLKKPLRPK